MTKKSEGRLARDEIKKNNRMWDELEEQYQSIVSSLRGPHDEMIKLYAEPLIYQSVPNKQETANAFRALSSDLRSFNADLTSIHNLHAGRTGGVKNDADEDMGAVVYEAYVGFNTRYHAVIMPSIIFMAEQAEKAKIALHEHFAKVLAQNPNVITDVEVKPVIPETGEITTDPEGNPLSQEDAELANSLLARFPMPVANMNPAEMLAKEPEVVVQQPTEDKPTEQLQSE